MSGRAPLLELRLAPRAAPLLLRALLGAAVLLCAASLAAVLLGRALELPRAARTLVALLDVDAERNLPTWWSATGLALAAAASGLLPWIAGLPARPRARSWLLLALALAAMSLDEYASLHEAVGHRLQAATGLTGVLFFAWVIPAAALVLLLGLPMLPLLREVPGRTRRVFLAAGGTYLAGALGLELVGGALASAGARRGPVFLAAATVEELLELVGVALLLYGLADYAGRASGAAPALARPGPAEARRVDAR